ncbi:MAG: hypothetical protein AAF989_03810, partial [Planctomycetota bacterium]
MLGRPCVDLHAGDGSSQQGLAANASDLSLEDLLRLHENQIASLVSTTCQWTVETTTAGGKTKQTFNTVAGPGYERTIETVDDVRGVCWGGKKFQRYIGYDPTKRDLASALQVKAFLLKEPVPGTFFFSWRAMRSYRFLTVDADSTLRELLDRSISTPRVTFENDLYVISAAPPPPAPGGVKFGDKMEVKIYLDPDHGFAIKKHHSVCTKPDDELIQTVSVSSFVSPKPGLYMPETVSANIHATSGGNSIAQKLVFEYLEIDQEIDYESNVFPENVIVREMDRFEDNDANQFYVTGPDGELGEPIPTEAEAVDVLGHRLADETPIGNASPSWVFLLFNAVIVIFLAV